MAEYINEDPCEFIYNITAVEKIVDGDTIDAVFDVYKQGGSKRAEFSGFICKALSVQKAFASKGAQS